MKLAGAALLLAATSMTLPAAWLHNPRERTATALRAWRRGDYAAASRDLERALDLSETSRTIYNAGTGRLANNVPGAALPLLTKAAEARGPERADALYNLGNAYLQVGDATAAIDAYAASLRQRPDFLPAKHNLELALRQLQKSPQQQPQQQPQPQGGQGKGQGGGGNGGGQQPPQQQPPQQNGGAGAQGPQQQPQQQQPQSGQQGSSQLPNFAPQKDMSPQQAAALLQAVENLEREQRRQQAQAQREARAKETTEKDW